ncbi:MAG TPA: sigma-70 family RNA polymerase sigma factor [Planctomycetota bacterium]|nr:sigma-70 family RNA polymerase sigma factor [Planctomycetota bacterium]
MAYHDGMAGFNDTQMMGDRHQFPTTSWNLVQSSRNVQALDALIKIYWKPLYFFVRQQGYTNETSKDIVQGFLTTLLEREALTKADPARGRFRTFLLAALGNFIKDCSKAETRLKRGGDQPIFSLDFVSGESDYAIEVARGETPETVLNQAWARSLWKHSLSELDGEPAHLEAFKLYLADANYDTISQKTGLSESAAKTAVHRLKGRLRDIIVGHIRETVSSEADLKAEVAEFMSLLS